MKADFQSQVVRQRDLAGHDLTGADFAGADVRGVSFRGIKLVGANFRGARTGIHQRWIVIFMAAFLLLALVAGALLGVAGAAAAVVVFPAPTAAGPALQMALPALGLLMIVLLLWLLFRRGLDASVAVFAVLAAGAIFLLIFVAAGFTGRIIVLVLGFVGLMGGAVLLGIVLAACRSLIGPTYRLLAGVVILIAASGASIAGWETIVSFRERLALDPHIVARLIAAAAVSMLFVVVSFLLAGRSMGGDVRFKLIRRAVVTMLSRRSTSFRAADLTEADFTGAFMGYADLREATLDRTNWKGAVDLDRAYVAGSYLADPLLCRLVTTKQGDKQNFDGLDMKGLNLQDAALAEASFIGANLSRACLVNADLRGARLVHTQLHDTDLSKANLTGAYIENWGVSTATKFDGVRCAYVYMHLPTEDQPDPLRKPDDNAEFFQEGDFSDFIAPIIRTLEYYHGQHTDPRTVAKAARAAKTLDLVQRQDTEQSIDPAISALAVQELAQRHPEAQMEIISLKAKDGDKVQIRTVVSDAAERNRMSEEFHAIYAAMQSLPAGEREQLLRNIVEKDTQIQQLSSMLLAAFSQQAFYVETSIRPAARVKCLLVAANPLNAADLRLDIEHREILSKLRATKYRDVFDLIPVPAARPDDLLQALNEHRPKIVQFSGHGDAGGQLLFMDERGYATPVAIDALRSLFAALKDDIRLVILNACYSQEQAGAIAEVVDCVVGMSDVISDDGAIVFIAAFYRALGFGRSVQNAFEQALVGVGLLGKREEEIPVLLTRNQVDADQVVLVAPDVLAPASNL